jgi:hypothetical protein
VRECYSATVNLIVCLRGALTCDILLLTLLLITPTNLHLPKSNFEATDAKMLRVSISTTYDMINVALKCFQEFGE